MPLGAATITVRATLDLLDNAFAGLANGIAQKRYSLWLGSGISRQRVDDLKGVIKRVLIYLRDHVETGKPNCRFLKALNTILTLAELSATEAADVRLDHSVDDWPILPIILQRLTSRYALLLDVTVEGEAPDFLLWDVVDVRNTFSAIAPDCEHLCIGILAIEGVIPDIASGNWDGLIEGALHELDGPGSGILRVCVRSGDLREPPLRSRLMKFHGCAVRAAKDPATYRSLLVGRQSQITAWPHEPVWAPMRNELKSLAVTKPTLMIGLSAQDGNIQDIFSDAQATMPWLWPCDPPAYVFAEDQLGSFQHNILRFVYRDAYAHNAVAIEQAATLSAFGKPLLVALVLYIWCAKLKAFADAVDAPGLSGGERNLIGGGLRVLRNRVAESASGVDLLSFIKGFVHETARGLALFQDGELPAAGGRSYRALGTEPVHQVVNDPTLPTSGVRELAAALGLLGLGEEKGDWRIFTGKTGVANDGILRIAHPGGGAVTRVFFAANSRAALRLEANGFIAADAKDAVVIHSTTPVAALSRSPRSAPGRTGTFKPRHVDMNSLLHGCLGLSDLGDHFRIEAAI